MSATTVLAGVAGAALILVILWDAFETVLVPRRIGRRVRLTRYFYLVAWRIWRLLALRFHRPSRREAFLGVFGPISLLLLLGCWATGLIVGFALVELAVSESAGVAPHHFLTLLYMSGETFFTLGFGDVTPHTTAGRWLAVFEAGMGFGFLGTVVGYLPTMYSAFSQREVGITLLDARAGSPPTAAELLGRVPRAGSGRTVDLLREWERWSAQVMETHISYPQLAYYRSQHTNQSWLGALVVVLDACALVQSCEDDVVADQGRLTFAMARHALVDITQIFVGHAPEPGDRLKPETLVALRARLADSAVPLGPDPGCAEHLAAIRILYEPYAKALADYLLIELPPWIHAERRRDNWQGGPWDRELAARADDHF